MIDDAAIARLAKFAKFYAYLHHAIGLSALDTGDIMLDMGSPNFKDDYMLSRNDECELVRLAKVGMIAERITEK